MYDMQSAVRSGKEVILHFNYCAIFFMDGCFVISFIYVPKISLQPLLKGGERVGGHIR